MEETGATNIKVNMAPSHLFWQQAEPIEAVKRLGNQVAHRLGLEVRRVRFGTRHRPGTDAEVGPQ